MKRALALTLLMLVVTSVADAETFRHWWRHHRILCMCIGIGREPVGGN